LNSEPEKPEDSSSELIAFIQRFFERHGAAVEESETGLDVLVPGPLMEQLSVAEFIGLGRGPGPVPASGSHPVHKQTFPVAYGSEFLERVLRHACAEVPVACCQLDFTYLKSQGFDALARECFQLRGGLLRVAQWAKVITGYMVLTCRYLAQSDEQKEGLFELNVHLETGAQVPAFSAGLQTASRSFKAGLAEPDRIQDQIRTIFPGLKRAADDAVRRETAAFHESMNRKYRRDVLNLEEYYRSLEKEMQQSLERTGLSDQLVRERLAKIALIPAELARKKDDLFKKYSLRISAAPCAALLVSTPAVKLLLSVAIGRKQKSLSAFYNPVTKTLDPLVCEGCRGSSTVMAFCDQTHLLCRDCAAGCPICRKPKS
jgi:hypothetical protein